MMRLQQVARQVRRFGSFAAAGTQNDWKHVLARTGLGLSGLGLAISTSVSYPSHLIDPEVNAAGALFSAAVLALFARKARPSKLVALPHAANAAVQLYQIGRWASSESVHQEGVQKTKVVVLGSGWAAASFLKNLDSKLTGDMGWYDVTVISPRNFFIYTPLLASAVTGTVETRSIIESTRSLMRGKGTYNEAECIGVDPKQKILRCRYNKPSHNQPPTEHHFELPYDVLVVAVGAVTNDFQTPGAREHAFFLKEATDAELLRARVNECFELASLPGTSLEKCRQLLTFCVVGGGPTGVEAAAELHDLVQDDLLSLFPKFKDLVSIKLIETRDHILGTFDRQISEFADKQFARQGIDVVYNSRVKEVYKDGVLLKHKDGEQLDKLTASTVIWCTGIKMNPAAEAIAAAMPDGQQEHRHALLVDDHLVVKGSGGALFAMGDAATIEQNRALDHAEELFKQADINNDGVLDCAEVRGLVRAARWQYPQLAEHARWFDCGDATGLLEELQDMMSSSSSWLPSWFKSSEKKEIQEVQQQVPAPGEGVPVAPGHMAAIETNAADVLREGSGMSITQEQFRAQLEKVDKTLRALPATAQVANQQGRYLATLFNSHRISPALRDTPNGLPRCASPFEYKHLGTFAYVGADKAVLELALHDGKEQNVFTGTLVGLGWKGVETWMQISARNKYLVMRDLAKCKIFGRDITDA